MKKKPHRNRNRITYAEKQALGLVPYRYSKEHQQIRTALRTGGDATAARKAHNAHCATIFGPMPSRFTGRQFEVSPFSEKGTL